MDRGFGLPEPPGSILETAGGYTLCPRQGVRRMQYVTYENLFLRKKEITAPS